jgi:hypothetical protein
VKAGSYHFILILLGFQVINTTVFSKIGKGSKLQNRGMIIHV